MSTPEDAITERAARALARLVGVYGFDAVRALEVVRALGEEEDGADDEEDVRRCVETLIDEHGCVDRGGPALGMSTTCAHCREVCASMPTTPARSCEFCETVRELWECLHCGFIGCGRYANAHGKAHWEASGHACAMSWDDLSVWCHACGTYVAPECSEALGAFVKNAERAKFGGAS